MDLTAPYLPTGKRDLEKRTPLEGSVRRYKERGLAPRYIPESDRIRQLIMVSDV